MPERRRSLVSRAGSGVPKYLDEFAQGINDYAKAHPDTICARIRVVLPVSGVDVVGHSLRVVHYMYMGSREQLKREVAAHLEQPAGRRSR